MLLTKLQPRILTGLGLLLALAIAAGPTAQRAQAQDDQPAQPAQAQSPDIVGGQPADPGEYPWQVWLGTTYYNGPVCGGSLVTPHWVTTAAHCVEAAYGPVSARPEDVTVVAGDHDWTTDEGTEQVLQVERIVIHPEWNPYASDNDIALLKLASDAVTGARVQPIQPASSPADDAALEAGDFSVVTGWGAIYSGGPGSSVLREVSVPIVDQGQCVALEEPYFNFEITENMICAGPLEGGKDSCQGDSGGPLVVEKTPENWRLGGIVSFGKGCAEPNYPGVYTRVTRYATWAQGYTAGTSGPQPVRNGSFEAGNDGAWDEVANSGAALITDAGLPVAARSGRYALWLGGPDASYEAVEQALPLDSQAATLRFHYQVRSAETDCSLNQVQVSLEAVYAEGYDFRTLATLPLCAGEETTGWQRAQLPLSGVEGQTVVVRLQFAGAGMESSLVVDDVDVAYGTGPLVSAFDPAAGEVGATVVLTGSNFSGATSVIFGGVPAAFTVNSPTQITAVVPPGALSGPIAVSGPAGEGQTPAPFNVLVQLEVVRAGSGSGRVVSAAAGIDCGADCSGLAGSISGVVLAAAAAADSTFAGWEGCGSALVCAPELAAGQTVTATFSLAPTRLVTATGETKVREPLLFGADTGLSPVEECRWSFGDGATLPCAGGAAAAAGELRVSAEYAYNAPGNFNATVSAANAAGAYTGTVSLRIAPTEKLFTFWPIVIDGYWP